MSDLLFISEILYHQTSTPLESLKIFVLELESMLQGLGQDLGSKNFKFLMFRMVHKGIFHASSKFEREILS